MLIVVLGVVMVRELIRKSQVCFDTDTESSGSSLDSRVALLIEWGGSAFSLLRSSTGI